MPGERTFAWVMLAFIVLMFTLVLAVAMTGCKAKPKYGSPAGTATASAAGSAKARFEFLTIATDTLFKNVPAPLRPFVAAMHEQAKAGVKNIDTVEVANNMLVGEANASRSTALSATERLTAEQDRLFSVKMRKYGYLAFAWVGGFLALGFILSAWAKFGSACRPLCGTLATAAFCLSFIGVFWLWLKSRGEAKEAKAIHNAVAALRK